jgi:uncharacterized protein (DUF885 family)
MRLIDRRSLLAGGALLAVAAAPGRDAGVRAELDRIVSLAPAERLAALRKIDPAGLSRRVRLDVAAASRGADLEMRIAAAGDAAGRYPLQLRLNAGWDITPADGHARGLAKAALLTVRADQLLQGQGLRAGSVAERLRQLARDPRYLYSDDDAGKDRAVADMNRWLVAAQGRLAAQFRAVPLNAYASEVVRMTPTEDAAGKAGYRTLPSGNDPGRYHVDLHQIRLRPSWSLSSVVHHETLPGHLIQLPMQVEADPHPLRLKAAPSFVEGWAIYAEQLSAESGAFASDPLAEIGYIQWMLFRLGRLLIDTGINHLGWSRDQALSFLHDLQGDPVIFAPFDKDVARAFAEPGMLAGQALTWLGIVDFRGPRTSGAKLSLFHDRMLAAGAAPIALLA